MSVTISPGLRLERQGLIRYCQPEALEHLVEHMIGEITKLAGADLQGHMPVP